MFIESHIHLTHPSFFGEFPCISSSKNEERIEYRNREQLIEEFKQNGVGLCIEPGIGIDSNLEMLNLAKENPGFLFVAVGVHPTRTFMAKWKERRRLEDYADKEGVVAIGELGLDYHYDRMKQHRLVQKMWFIWQLNLAYRKKLPLILHIRMAEGDAIKILRRHKNKINGGVCHCFNGGVDTARIYTEEMGLLLGIGGSILQEDAKETGLLEAVKKTPLSYLILETDGPFVKPEKPENVTGKKWKKARNTSLIIPDIAAKIAEIKNISVEEVENATTENVLRTFPAIASGFEAGGMI